jgi:hypothetical protein
MIRSRIAIISAVIALIIATIVLFFHAPREIDVDITSLCIREKFINRLNEHKLSFYINESGIIVYKGDRMKEFEKVGDKFNQWWANNMEEANDIIHKCRDPNLEPH